MSNIMVHITFLPGIVVEAAIAEAREKACLWEVAYVSFSFNGVSMSISPTANVDKVTNDFKNICKGRTTLTEIVA